jgi:hypothetical protein
MLTTKQRRAINAILTCRTLEAAAREVKVTSKTLQRWLNDLEFKATLKEAEDSLFDNLRRRLADGQDAALDALKQVITNGTDANRRQAAAAWLEFRMRTQDRDIDARLTALEREIYGPERTKNN